jgi:hypothetical protein
MDLSTPWTPRIGRMQCSATAKHSGVRCKRPATSGTNVCNVHGAMAPQVKRSAEARVAEARAQLLDMVVPGLKRYRELLSSAQSEAVSATLLRDLLDRTGLAPTTKVEQRVSLTQERSVDDEIAALLSALDQRDPPPPEPVDEPAQESVDAP